MDQKTSLGTENPRKKIEFFYVTIFEDWPLGR